MTAPSNYDDSGMMIRVDPDTLFRYATVDIANHASVIVDALNNIAQVWEDLKVGWVGKTAEEAQHFNQRWNQALEQLFGTKDDASTGALSKIATGVALASVNYGEAEDVVVKMFVNMITSQLVGMVQGLPPSQPHSIGPAPTRQPDTTLGPITENAPPPP